MEPKREQAFVGLFVIVACAVLIGTVFVISGVFGRTTKTYHARVPFAGGLEPGTTVRYAGGPKVGSVERLRIHPQHPSLFDVSFKVQSALPVNTDSHVKIMSLSPLGDNHLEILPGTPQAAVAPDGSLLAADKYVDFNALTQQINDISPRPQELLKSLNEPATELKVTVDRLDYLLSVQNHSTLSATPTNSPCPTV